MEIINMGTNYYLVEKDIVSKRGRIEWVQNEILFLLKDRKDVISERSYKDAEAVIRDLTPDNEPIHIGKNSGGWRFSFAGDNFKGLADFLSKFDKEKYKLEDEYHKEIPLQEFIERVVSTLNNPIRDHRGESVDTPAYTHHYHNDKVNEEGYRIVMGEYC
jgi:hypothetical protein